VNDGELIHIDSASKAFELIEDKVFQKSYFSGHGKK
jgi:hypothetical protein